ncbi:MAG: nucleotidyltransferase family protein [Candidatus Odinarchaeia archaeon]
MKKKIEDIKKILSKYKKELKKKYKIKEIGIFGSYVKGCQRENSDIDVLVSFENGAKLSLIDVVALEIELSELFGTKVDLVEKKNLKPYIKENILNEVVYV